MRIICISGKAQHGKDTAGTIIKEKLEAEGFKVLVTHYADLLKYICSSFFDWDGKKDEAGRQLLQYVGTEVVRTQRPDFWVNFIIDVLDLFPTAWDYIIIPDCRFPNEVERLKNTGADIIHVRVVRDGFESPLTSEQQVHPSETALDNFSADKFIFNSSSIEDLRTILNEWLETLIGYHQIALSEI